jgi:hypothetical protein
MARVGGKRKRTIAAGFETFMLGRGEGKLSRPNSGTSLSALAAPFAFGDLENDAAIFAAIAGNGAGDSATRDATRAKRVQSAKGHLAFECVKGGAVQPITSTAAAAAAATAAAAVCGASVTSADLGDLFEDLGESSIFEDLGIDAEGGINFGIPCPAV